MMRRIRGLLGLVLLLALAVGLPWALAATVGNPLDQWSALTSGDISDQVVIAIMAAVAYLAWATFAAALLVELGAGMAAAITRRPRRTIRIPLLGVQQDLARTLVAAVLLLLPAVMSVAGPAASAVATPAQPSGGYTAPQHVSTPAPSTSTAALQVDQQPAAPTSHVTSDYRHHAATTTYTIPEHGGMRSYWALAKHYLGDGQRWPEIWHLNQGQQQPDGTVMDSPNLLRRGWTVTIPAGAGGGAVAQRGQQHVVTVDEGDTMSGLAQDAGVKDWTTVWDDNAGRIEPGGRHLTDPNVLFPGDQLTMPGPATAASPGTTLRPPTTPATTAPSHTTPGSQTPLRTGQPNAGEPSAAPSTPAQPSTPARPTAPAAQQQAEVPSGAPGSPATPSAPTTAPHSAAAASAPASSRPAVARQSSDLPMVVFAGGGVLLAGISLTALIGYRRRQFRQRRPGHAITSCSPELLRVERALLSVGGPAIIDVTWLDQTLRSLTHGFGSEGATRLPDVVAVRMGRDRLELILASAQPIAPAPWTVDETGTRWSIARDEESDYDPAQRAYHFAPFPMLTSVGYAEDGSQWLLDLERVASMSLAGDPERCLNLARFLACELAHNAWSEMLQVTLVGFGRELSELNPDRLTYTEDFDAAIAELAEQVHTVEESLRETGVGVLDARAASTGDVWAPHVLLIAPDAARDKDGLERLLATMRAQHSRMAVALVLSDDPDHVDATTWTMTIGGDGTLHIPALGLVLRAQQIPADEAAELAQRLALAARPGDEPMPRSTGTHPWDKYSDAAGALRVPADEADTADGAGEPFTVEPSTSAASSWGGATDIPALHLADSSPWMTTSVLPLSHETYLEQTATTEEDIVALAPETNDEIREEVESTVGDLDADVAEWYDETTVRPKVSVLGPVTVRGQGPLPARNPRTQWHTEIVAYLATRPSGVSSEQYATALWPNDPDRDLASKSKVRQSMMIVRKWLGKNPSTGIEYIPPAMAPGYASYRLEGALLDAELFRRLRLRGLARGKDGMDDLWAALRLVTGEPFSQRRQDGYVWLADNPLDHIYSAMIVDVAHTVATHHLAAGEPDMATEAAQIALAAGSKEDVPLLDLVAACDARGHRVEAKAFIQRILANHDAEVEEDCPPRTAEVLRRRQWLDNAS